MSKTLCSFVKDGMIENQPLEYLELVLKPKYLCGKCGRLARKKNSLCKAVSIKKIKTEK